MPDSKSLRESACLLQGYREWLSLWHPGLLLSNQYPMNRYSRGDMFNLLMPGIGTISSPCANSQARDNCAGVQLFLLAILLIASTKCIFVYMYRAEIEDGLCESHKLGFG